MSTKKKYPNGGELPADSLKILPIQGKSKNGIVNVNSGMGIMGSPNWLNMGTLPTGQAYFMNKSIPNDPNRYIFNNGSYEPIKFAGGGQFKDFMGNYLKASADTSLSLLGFDNVIQDSAYKGKSADGFTKYTGAVAKVGDIARPIAGGIAGGLIGGPMGASVGSQIGSGLGQLGDALVPQNIVNQTIPQPMLPQQGSAAYDPYQVATGGYKFPGGGQIGAPNVELEKQENTLNPDGSTTQFNGPSHENGGIPAKLDPSTLVFSDRLKKDGKTFADLNKPNMTKKEDKLLEDGKSTRLQKLTAELMKSAKNKKSLALFQEQEQAKMNKMAKYAGRIGYKMPDGGQTPYGPYQTSANPLYPLMMNLIANQTALEQTAGQTAAPYSMNTKMTPFDIQDPVLPNTPQYNPIAGNQGSNIPWGQIGQGALQVGLGLAANAGNFQALKNSKDYDVQSFERVAPDLLDPSAALRENSQSFRNAAEQIKDASMGNSATFIQNRRALNTDRMMRDNSIRKEFGNINANISNNAKMFNANQQVNESNANLANKARMQDMRTKAISDIGHNVYSQGTNIIRDNKMAKTQEQYLSIIAAKYPEILKDPELRKVFGL